jgi:hypothetical protein
VSTTKSTTESLEELIARRNALKINFGSHLRADPSQDAPGDQQRDELAVCIGAITTAMHEPFKIEADRLREKRAQIAAEHETAQYQRALLRHALVHAQGARMATLACGDDAAEHAVTADELSSEVNAIERLIDDTAARVRGVDEQLIALTVAEAANIQSGVSAA